MLSIHATNLDVTSLIGFILRHRRKVGVLISYREVTVHPINSDFITGYYAFHSVPKPRGIRLFCRRLIFERLNMETGDEILDRVIARGVH